MLELALPGAVPAAVHPRSTVTGVNDTGNDANHDMRHDSHAAAVHEYVKVCLQVLQQDPWSLGAVQGECEVLREHLQHLAPGGSTMLCEEEVLWQRRLRV
jgi:hypothetical protein